MNITASYVMPKDLKEQIAAMADNEYMSASMFAKKIFMAYVKKHAGKRVWDKLKNKLEDKEC